MSLWSYDELLRLKQMDRRGYGPGLVARATAHTLEEVDLARWHLLGRDIPEACDALNLAQIDSAGQLNRRRA